MNTISTAASTPTAASQPQSKIEPESDFEHATWKEAVQTFRSEGHKAPRAEEFLKIHTTPQQVSATLEKQRNDAPAQYGPVMTKLLGKIDIFLTAGDIAVKGAPESVGLAWTGISLALGSVQDDFATFQVFSGTCTDIIGILVTCRLFGKMFAASTGPPEFFEIQEQVRNQIPKVYASILDFSYRMYKYMDRHKFLRITRGILKNHKEEFSGSLQALKDGERVMSDNATRASQALTAYWQQRSDLKQDEALSELRRIRDQLDQSAATSKELNEYLKNELAEQRRKTPMDVAREVYARQKIALKAAVDTEAMLDRRKSSREEGTCNWIFDLDAYKQWHDSPRCSTLWISGGGNMGKSVLVSSIIEHLQRITLSGIDARSHFVFCKSGDDNAQKTDRILDHLLFAVYDMVPMNLDALDKANQVVGRYLAGRTQVKTRDQSDKQEAPEVERILSFENAYLSIGELLRKRIYVVVDALDVCSDRKEEELVARLSALTKRHDLNINVLLTSRPEPDINKDMEVAQVVELRMEKYNEDDIWKTVESQLNSIPGMTTNERSIAKDKICCHAGPYFGYVKPALDLFRRPWRRPIEAHLEQLPDNLLNMNAHSILDIPSLHRLVKDKSNLDHISQWRAEDKD